MVNVSRILYNELTSPKALYKVTKCHKSTPVSSALISLKWLAMEQSNPSFAENFVDVTEGKQKAMKGFSYVVRRDFLSEGGVK